MSTAPRATYRLQLTPELGLDDAAEQVDALAALGVSHLYLSPIWPAVPGSRHGYDVVRHDDVREELGGEPALERLAAAAHARGLGLIVDIVPSHMAAAPAFNTAWWDLLERGRQSAHASWFDVDWGEADREGGGGQVLLPWLDGPAEAELQGPLKIARRGEGLVARLPQGELPVRPGSLTEAEAPRELRGPALTRFLDRQCWRLVSWRGPRRNVRRFFEIDDLVALRCEREPVFRATHAALLGWVERGLVDGLRIDHVDGLRDPRRYLELLRAAAPDCWIGVEKILARDETLPREWPVDGTTGYELMTAADELLVDPGGLRGLRALLTELTGDARSWEEVVRHCRGAVLARLFPAELERCTRAFEAALVDPPARDALRAGLAAVLIELDVYRTYLRPGRAAPAPGDVARIEAACARARARGEAPAEAIELLRELLLDPDGDGAQRELVELFQTLAPALTAKAVEDTALYRHHPLASLNEVGGDPEVPDDPRDHFHAAMAGRVDAARRGGLSPTATHDAKRGAATRARLALLSELPEDWSVAVRRWRERNARHRTGELPDARVESLYYQTLVGAWPIGVERARAYMLKAAREAKQHTSWRAPDEAYERALLGFVEGTLADEGFVAELEELVRPLVDPGRRQCLALALLAAAAPGIPDIYNGCELWDRTLVDPDNRRPVDLDLRRELLAGLDGMDAAQAWARREEGAPMLYLWKHALDLRRRLPVALSAAGTYVPLPARGAHARRVVAFARSARDGAAAAVAPRLGLGLRGGWGDTVLELPEGPWRDALSGAEHAGGATAMEELLAGFPVALLERVGGDA